MADMISIAAAIELIENRQRKLCPVGMFSRNAVYGSDLEKFDCWQEIIDEIERLPAVDALQVVRCKECKHSYFASNRVPEKQCLACEEHGIDVTDDWYCADGERRESE